MKQKLSVNAINAPNIKPNKAPTNKLSRYVINIEQEFEKSQFKLLQSLKDAMGENSIKEMMELNDKNKTSKKTKFQELTREFIIQNLMSGGADMEKCFDSLRYIFSKCILFFICTIR